MPSLLQRCPSRLSNVFGQRTNSRSAERGKENLTRSRDCSASNLSFPILPRPAGSRSGLSGSYAAMDKHRRHSEAELGGGFDESEKGMGWGRGLGEERKGTGLLVRRGAATNSRQGGKKRRKRNTCKFSIRERRSPSLPSFPFHASSQGSTSSFVIHEAVTAQQSQSQHAAFHIRRSPVSRRLRL